MTCPCQQLVEDTLAHHAIHYHAEAKDAQIEILDKFNGRSGFFLKKFLIGAEFNMNQWRTPWNAIKKDAKDFEGKPVVLTPARDHPRVHEQDNYKIGEIVHVELDELKQVATQISQIFDKRAQKLIREKKVRFGSPTVLKYSDAETVENKLGNGRVQTTLNRFVPAHDALVEDPAYGKQVDFIPAVCDGTGKGCALKLQAVSASVEKNSQVEQIIRREHELLDQGIEEKKVHEMLKTEFASDVNSDNTDQLTIVPFVKKTLKANFNHKTLSQMVDYSKRTRQGSSDSCVSRKISILADEHPEWDHDQTIAVAYSYCNKGKSAEIEKSILGDLTPEILDVHEKIRKQEQQKANLVEVVDATQRKFRQFKAADDEDGQWITVKGNHIFIPEGEDKETAIKDFFDKKQKGTSSPAKPDKRVSEITSAYPNLKEDFVKKQLEIAPSVQAKAKKANDELQAKLKKDLPGAVISGRVKTVESMIGKVGRKPKYKSIQDLHDNSGVRAMFDDVSSVKEAMKKVKSDYTIVEEDNYIDKPKFDGYRSYHAIIRDKNGVESELQIRTKRQDKFAIWAHDLYKPPTDDLKNFVDTHQDLVIDYSVQMSDYLAALDEGRNTKKPDCPKPIEEVEMCL